MRYFKIVLTISIVMMLGSCIPTMSMDHIRGAFDDRYTFVYAQPSELVTHNQELADLGCEDCQIVQMMHIQLDGDCTLWAIEFNTIASAVQYESLFNQEDLPECEQFEVLRRRDAFIILGHDLETVQKAIKGR